MHYYTYITSRRWRDNPARLAELKAARFRCRLCNASADDVQLEVHHRTYERLGCERPDDLVALCRDCHCAVTDMLRRRLYLAANPRFADVISAIDNAPPLFTPSHKRETS